MKTILINEVVRWTVYVFLMLPFIGLFTFFPNISYAWLVPIGVIVSLLLPKKIV